MHTLHTVHTPTGHAHHFLSRLDRVTRPQIELALSLYRDDDLVQFILERARLPEGAKRVAIALGDTGRGPFLVVTREGRFVTCLGEGMRPADLSVITRAQLDGHLTRARDMRARNEALFAIGEPAAELYGRVIRAGEELSREQFVAASASTARLRVGLVALGARVFEGLEEFRSLLVPVLRRTHTPRTTLHPAMRAYEKLAWASGHLAVLSAVDGPGLIEAMPPLAPPSGPLLSLFTLRQGIVSVALKGLWAAGKLGRELLTHYKHVLMTSTSHLALLDAVLGLTVLGLRHRRLRAEVQKVFAVPGIGAPGCRALIEGLVDMARETMADPDRLTAVHRARGAATLVAMTRHLPVGSQWRFERVEDVPEDLAMTAGVSGRGDFFKNNALIGDLFVALPWLARAKAEELYFPGALIRALRVPWHPSRVIALLEGHCAAPVAKPDDRSRGVPCACRSGRKFKRCCGEDGRAEDRHVEELRQAA